MLILGFCQCRCMRGNEVMSHSWWPSCSEAAWEKNPDLFLKQVPPMFSALKAWPSKKNRVFFLSQLWNEFFSWSGMAQVNGKRLYKLAASSVSPLDLVVPPIGDGPRGVKPWVFVKAMEGKEVPREAREAWLLEGGEIFSGKMCFTALHCFTTFCHVFPLSVFSLPFSMSCYEFRLSHVVCLVGNIEILHRLTWYCSHLSSGVVGAMRAVVFAAT